MMCRQCPEGWLVNNCLTCIPGTKTFWHDLLEWIPGLVDKTAGYTDYTTLASVVEREAADKPPDYVIRNATFFRSMNLQCKQISLLQDCYDDKTQQIDTCNKSNITVFNSNFTYNQYKDYITECDVKIIPLGVDLDIFKPMGNKDGIRQQLGILPNSILFVGSSLSYPKGFDVVLNLINTTDYNFCLVMKDNFKMSHNRVRIFNMIDHESLTKVYNSCDMLLCTSVIETQHLATIEAGGCGLPILTTNVGALHNISSGEWGAKVIDKDYVGGIEYIKSNLSTFSPRQYFLDNGFDKEICKSKWLDIIKEVSC